MPCVVLTLCAYSKRLPPAKSSAPMKQTQEYFMLEVMTMQIFQDFLMLPIRQSPLIIASIFCPIHMEYEQPISSLSVKGSTGCMI